MGDGVGVQAVPVNGLSQPQPYGVQTTTNADLRYTEKLLRARSWISCWALVDIFLIILSLYSIGMWGLVLLIGPVSLSLYPIFTLLTCLSYSCLVITERGH